MNRDLTEGKTSSVLYLYTLPIFISTLFQQFYNIADSAIAGRFAGEDALAAIGASYSITMIFIAIATGSSTGCTVVISQLFGSKNIKKVRTAAYTALIFGTVLSVVLTAVSLICSKMMLVAIKTPSGIFADAQLYLNIYFLGYIFIYLYNMANGVFTALGDSKTPLYLLIFSSFANVGLDLLFVAVFHWGVGGAAWATFITQGIACALSVVLVIRRLHSMSEVNEEESGSFAGGAVARNGRYWSTELLGLILGISIPSILQTSFVSVGNLLIQSLVNGYGEATIAGFSAAVKLNTLTTTCFTTMTNGISAFTAQNIGAKKYSRIKEALRAGMIIAAIASAIFMIAYCVFGEFALSLFLDKDASAEALAVGERFLSTIALFYLVIAVKIMIDGVLKGAKAMKLFMISTFVDLLIRVILSFALSKALALDALMYGWIAGWTVSCVLSLIFYFSGSWKKYAYGLKESEAQEAV